LRTCQGGPSYHLVVASPRLFDPPGEALVRDGGQALPARGLLLRDGQLG
jgi:hypothetical protein